jgi:hypothetical protein
MATATEQTFIRSVAAAEGVRQVAKASVVTWAFQQGAPLATYIAALSAADVAYITAVNSALNTLGGTGNAGRQLGERSLVRKGSSHERQQVGSSNPRCHRHRGRRRAPGRRRRSRDAGRGECRRNYVPQGRARVGEGQRHRHRADRRRIAATRSGA